MIFAAWSRRLSSTPPSLSERLPEGEADGDAEQIGIVEFDPGGLIPVIIQDLYPGWFSAA